MIRSAHSSLVLSPEQMATNLAPDQHGSEDDLQAVEKVVPDDDDGSAPCGPAFAGADGFDAGGCCKIHKGGGWEREREMD